MKSLIVLTFYFLLLTFNCFSQSNIASFGFWHITSFSGELKFNALYREQTTHTNFLDDKQSYSLYSGGILLRSGSYILQPKFLVLDISAEYNPQKYNEQYLVIPEHSETSNIKKLDIRATLFSQRKITLTSFLNLNEGFSNRENLSNIRTSSTSWGGLLSYSNKILPWSISYHQVKWDQEELQNERIYRYNQTTIESTVSQSFFSSDRHELTYTHDDYTRRDLNFASINNISDKLSLINSLYFDKKKNYHFYSNVSDFEMRGYDNYNRFQANENLTFRLPYHFNFLSNYNYYNIKRESQEFSLQSLNLLLGHKLGECLQTNLIAEYNNISQTFYSEKNRKAGIELTYEKKLPTDGLLSFSYNYSVQHQIRKSEPFNLQVMSERYALTDGKIVLLKNPNVDLASIVVRDETGIIIYQLNSDYVLIQRNKFVEIQRRPGGQIPNNGLIFVDYTFLQTGSYSYNINYNYFSTRLLLINRIFELYFRYGKQDYKKLEQTEMLTLNYYTQRIYGGSINFKFGSGGVEYEDYQSNIIPYKLIRYFVLVQGNINNTLLYSLNGNIRDYRMISEQVNQKYSDVSGMLTYMLNNQSKLLIEAGYRNQQGHEINLDLITARTEFSTVFRKLYFTLGFEYYNRHYIQDDIRFKGVYVRLSRKF